MPSASVSLDPSLAGSLLLSGSAEHPVANAQGRAKDHDDTLLLLIGNGDQEAYRSLVERHIDRAYGVALRILDNRADAEDVVQDVFLKVWTHRGRWEGGKAKFSTWLYRVVTMTGPH